MKRQLADWINTKTHSWTVNRQRLLLWLTCLLVGGFSAWVCCQPLGQRRVPAFLQVLTQTNNRRLPLPDLPSGDGIPKSLYDRILSAKHNDSLLRARPLLLDSIRVIEQYYQEHSKK